MDGNCNISYKNLAPFSSRHTFIYQIFFYKNKETEQNNSDSSAISSASFWKFGVLVRRKWKRCKIYIIAKRLLEQEIRQLESVGDNWRHSLVIVLYTQVSWRSFVPWRGKKNKIRKSDRWLFALGFLYFFLKIVFYLKKQITIIFYVF